MRVVLDTNVLVSALLFSRSHMSWLRQAWQSGQLRPVVSRQTVAELLCVLAYPKFQLSAADQEDLLADFLPFAETVSEPTDNPSLPRCTDPDDQKFLTLAAEVEALVSGDAAVLALAGKLPVSVLTVDELRNRLSQA